jgi:hypothetical protein
MSHIVYLVFRDLATLRDTRDRVQIWFLPQSEMCKCCVWKDNRRETYGFVTSDPSGSLISNLDVCVCYHQLIYLGSA